MNVPAILFDLDGTLIDSLQSLGDAANVALAAGGFPTHPISPYRQFVGDGARMLIERALPEDARDVETIDRTLARFRDAYAVGWPATTVAYEGVHEMLAGVMRTHKVGILSNKPDEFAGVVVARLFPGVAFALVRGAMEDVPMKPDPTVGGIIAAEWGLAPAEIAYVGDGSPDIRFAKAAGMPSVGVAYGFRGEEELRREGADVVVQTVGELAALFGG